MKKLLIGCLILSTSSVFAVTQTDMNTNWVCSTNASSSKETTDKAADQIMVKTPGSATSAFDFAVKNCRDCTKITCKVAP
jgi:hypothetical protein